MRAFEVVDKFGGSKGLSYQQFMMFLHLMRKDSPEYSNNQNITPEDHRLLAAYYTNAFGLRPMAALVLVFRLSKLRAQSTKIFLRYHDNHSKGECIVCERIVNMNAYSKEASDHLAYEEDTVHRLADLLDGYKKNLAMLRCCVMSS